MAVEEIKLAQEQDVGAADALNVSGPSRNRKSKSADPGLGTVVGPSMCRESLAEEVEKETKPEVSPKAKGPVLAEQVESKTVLDDVASGLHDFFISVADGLKNMEKKVLDMLGGGEMDELTRLQLTQNQRLAKKRKAQGLEEDLEEDELEESPQEKLEDFPEY